MSNPVVNLFVNDNGFNAKIKNAARTFASLGNAASSAKAHFDKFADSIGQVTQVQQVFNAAVKNNPYGLLAQAATVAFTKVIEKATEATDAEKRAMEWAQVRAEREQEVNDAIGKSTGDLLAKYEMLRIEWNTLSSDQQRNEWIKNNQSAFKGLNLAVTDVTSAENVFVNNTNNVVEALKARAQAEAYGELYKQAIIKKAKNDASPTVENGRIVQSIDPKVRNSDREKLAGVTAKDINWVNKTVVTENGDSEVIQIFESYKQTAIAKLRKIMEMGAQSIVSAEDMEIERYGNLMAQSKINANNLSNNNLFGYSGGGSGRGGNQSGPSIDDFNKALRKSFDNKNKIKPGDYIEQPSIWAEYADGIRKSMETIDTSMNNLTFDHFMESYDGVQQQVDDLNKKLMQQQAAYNLAGQAAQGFGAALQGIENPAAKAAGTVMQAVASIALGFAMASSNANTAGTGWGWLAWLAAGASAMATTISMVHSLTGFANGGMVSGSSYSGDNIPIMANAGEVVLTRAQQSNLANALEGEGRAPYIPSHISGEQIYLALNRYMRRSGRGELVSWK